MLLKPLFKADVAAECISLSVFEKAIKKHSLDCLQLLLQVSPRGLLSPEDFASKKEVLYFASENGVSLAMVELLVGQLDDAAPGCCLCKSYEDPSPFDIAIALGHQHIVTAYRRLFVKSSITRIHLSGTFVLAATKQRVETNLGHLCSESSPELEKLEGV